MLTATAQLDYHLLPGRLRIRINGLKNNPIFAEYLTSKLSETAGIKHVQANHLTGKVLIYFDQAKFCLDGLVKTLKTTLYSFHRLANNILVQKETVPSRAQPLQAASTIDLQHFAAPKFPCLTPKTPSSVEPIHNAHSLSPEELCSLLETSDKLGLSEREVKGRVKTYGYNLLTEGKRLSFWEMLKNQFKDLMVQILLGAAGISFFLGQMRHAALTMAIVTANAVIGVIQEKKACQSIDSLKKLSAPQARVIRDGRLKKINAQDLVPGDIIVLETGDKVPADARLIMTNHLEVEEASLTGETVPAKKDCNEICPHHTPLGDRSNMIFMGTAITRGKGVAVVTATGMSTEMGHIAKLIENHEEESTPLQRRLEELGKYLAYGCLLVSGVVMLTGVMRGQGLLQMIQVAASLAVAAIPEGLTAIVIIALAMGIQRMSKNNIIVRKLSAIETLGCTNVICSDKTGTLTKNEMTVRSIITLNAVFQVTGDGYEPEGNFVTNNQVATPESYPDLMETLLIGTLCNNSHLNQNSQVTNQKIVPINKNKSTWKIDGDPTEGSLVVAATKAGLWHGKLHKKYAVCQENPFESERRMMSILFKTKNHELILYCKGAPDKILKKCSHGLLAGQEVALDDNLIAKIRQEHDKMTNQALRVLACAYRKVPDSLSAAASEELEQDMVFCGLVGIMDPPRPEAAAAIEKCRQAGVKVVMITGDHPNTARAIGQEIGLLTEGSKIVLGTEIDAMSDQELADIVGQTAIFARTSPHHKLRIVQAFKEKKYVVAMTGDGVNDAPAVKASDVGIAMGLMGTDVTKEAASMTLADDNFATIVHAMKEGRSIYANIRKAIRYLLATNIGEVVLMFFAALIGLPMPMLPIHLLWINLVGDGLPAVALVNDPPAQDVMQQSPRKGDESVFSDGLGRKIVTRGLIIGVTSLAVFTYKLRSSGNILAARTLVLLQLALSQFIHLFDCRMESRTGKVPLFSNIWLIAATALSVAMVAGVMYIPFLQQIVGTMSLGLGDWIFALSTAALTAIVDWRACQWQERTLQNRMA